jgi:hypothetical protein
MTCRQRENHGDTRDGDTRTPDNRRALATGNPLVATAAALELPRVRLEDALALVLLYQGAG